MKRRCPGQKNLDCREYKIAADAVKLTRYRMINNEEQSGLKPARMNTAGGRRMTSLLAEEMEVRSKNRASENL